MKKIEPISEQKKQIAEVEKKILQYLHKILFEPLIVTLQKDIKNRTLQNSLADLKKVFENGQLKLIDNKIVGRLNARLSSDLLRIGAIFDKYEKVFKISPEQLPLAIKQAIQKYIKKQAILNMQISNTLEQIQHNLFNEQPVELILNYYTVIENLDQNISKQLHNLTVEAKFTEKQKLEIARKYNENMNYYVTKFLNEEIIEMRKIVEQNFLAGYRSENLIDQLQQRYGISARKANFLAKQETRLLSTHYQEIKYRSANITHFKWRHSHISEEPRPLHLGYDGKIFEFANPPIIDEKTGQRGLPGEAFNCQCKIIPIVLSE